MKYKFLILVVFFLNAIFLNAQFAIIQDKDGYTNIREKPRKDSKLIVQIFNNHVFWFDADSFDKGDEWIEVLISKNPFTIGGKESNHISGYIYRSRIKPLKTLEEYKGTNFYIKYNIQKFDSLNKIIDRYNVKYHDNYEISYEKSSDGTFVEAINGLPVWGTDGDLPTNYIKSIEVKMADNVQTIHPFFYSDLYEVNNNFNIYNIGNTFFVCQSNSDGAGHYDIVWVFQDGELIQRFVISMC